jgi:ABC-2 type transport system permease protein
MTGEIRDQRYRRRDPRSALRRFRALPIARETLRQVLSRRALLVFLALALVPFVLGAGGLFLLSRVPDMARALPEVAVLYVLYLRFQLLFAVLLSVWAGAGLVAEDLRTGALLVFLSRPLHRADYILGKLSVLFGLNFAVIALPPLLLWLLAAALDPQGLGVRGPAFLPLSIVAQAALAAAVLSLMTLGASAIAGSGTLAGLFVAGAFIVFAFDGALRLAPESARPILRLLSVPGHLTSVGRLLFGLPPDPGAVPWSVGLLALLVIAAAMTAALARRVRAVDVVS